MGQQRHWLALLRHNESFPECDAIENFSRTFSEVHRRYRFELSSKRRQFSESLHDCYYRTTIITMSIANRFILAFAVALLALVGTGTLRAADAICEMQDKVMPQAQAKVKAWCELPPENRHIVDLNVCDAWGSKVCQSIPKCHNKVVFADPLDSIGARAGVRVYTVHRKKAFMIDGRWKCLPEHFVFGKEYLVEE